MAPVRPIPLGWELQLCRRWNVLVYRNLLTGEYQLEKPQHQISLTTDEVFSLSDEGPLRKQKPDQDQTWLATNSERKLTKRKYERVAVRHILIKHYKSEHTAMCRILKHARKNRTKQQACDFAKAIRSSIVSKEVMFHEAAIHHSECCTALQRGFMEPIYQKDNSDENIKKVAFSLDVGEISQPFETKRGYHIIERIA